MCSAVQCVYHYEQHARSVRIYQCESITQADSSARTHSAVRARCTSCKLCLRGLQRHCIMSDSARRIVLYVLCIILHYATSLALQYASHVVSCEN
jgi:hypothetical protein